MTKTIKVDGMTCTHCSGAVEKALGGLSEVQSVKVDLEAKTATMKLSSEVADEKLKRVIEAAGYTMI